MVRTSLTIIAGLIIIYGLLCVALYVFQRSLIYFPQPTTAIKGTDVIDLAVDDINLKIATLQRHNSGAVIYFGGNAEDVSQSIPELGSAFPDRAIYAMHYRGYGGSEGKPSEDALIKDALLLFNYIKSKHGDIVVIGRSLGSGVAIQVASQTAASRLILITPYDSIQNIAANQFPFFPVRLLLTDKFESWKYAPTISTPTTIITAEFDEVIPQKNSTALLENFPLGIAKAIVIRGAGHNSISSSPEYIPALQNNK